MHWRMVLGRSGKAGYAILKEVHKITPAGGRTSIPRGWAKTAMADARKRITIMVCGYDDDRCPKLLAAQEVGADEGTL